METLKCSMTDLGLPSPFSNLAHFNQYVLFKSSAIRIQFSDYQIKSLTYFHSIPSTVYAHIIRRMDPIHFSCCILFPQLLSITFIIRVTFQALMRGNLHKFYKEYRHRKNKWIKGGKQWEIVNGKQNRQNIYHMNSRENRVQQIDFKAINRKAQIRAHSLRGMNKSKATNITR